MVIQREVVRWGPARSSCRKGWEDTWFSSQSSGDILRTFSRESRDTFRIIEGMGSLLGNSLGNSFGAGGRCHLSAGSGAEKSEERFGLLVFGNRGKGFLMFWLKHQVRRGRILVNLTQASSEERKNSSELFLLGLWLEQGLPPWTWSHQMAPCFSSCFSLILRVSARKAPLTI